MKEFLWSAADLPDSLVCPLPVLSKPFEDALNILPAVVGNGSAVFIRQVNRIHHLAVNVELKLLIRSVSDPHRARVFVSGKILETAFVQLFAAINSVYNLQRSPLRIVAQATFQPADECLGFLDDTKSNQGVKSEAGVAQPCVSIVPVADPANCFRQSKCRRGD